jgi:hypothetical protein
MRHGLGLNKLFGSESESESDGIAGMPEFHPKANPVSSLTSNLDLTKGSSLLLLLKVCRPHE